ncbi:MAG TPA: hypothetical protein DIT64_17415 [Verrucomicrobiales bacterium]|nr:hypothetical protein [Verrucomicrobiales bacterium]HRJ10113.1 hypothetical protein [Prosthecobacter sp.]HRK16229.1 hypothetical protein [Prosthecobacter sp.]
MHGSALLAVIHWWCDLTKWRRYAFCLALIAADTVLAFAGKQWFAGWAVGLVLLGCTFLGVGED